MCDEIPSGMSIPAEDLRSLGGIPVGDYLAKRKRPRPTPDEPLCEWL